MVAALFYLHVAWLSTSVVDELICQSFATQKSTTVYLPPSVEANLVHLLGGVECRHVLVLSACCPLLAALAVTLIKHCKPRFQHRQVTLTVILIMFVDLLVSHSNETPTLTIHHPPVDGLHAGLLR